MPSYTFLYRLRSLAGLVLTMPSSICKREVRHKFRIGHSHYLTASKNIPVDEDRTVFIENDVDPVLKLAKKFAMAFLSSI